MIVIDIPGKFMSYLDGSSLMQEEPIRLDSLERVCRIRIDLGDRIKRGRSGYSIRVWFPDEQSAGILADLADTCIVANFGGEVDRAEVAAARKVLARLAAQGVTPV